MPPRKISGIKQEPLLCQNLLSFHIQFAYYRTKQANEQPLSFLWSFRMFIHSTFFALLLFISLQAEAVKLSDGISYEHIETEQPLSIHILRINPKKCEIQAIRAWNYGIGSEPLRSMAQRTAAIAAINGGFFRLTGQPAGILKIKHRYIQVAKKNRGAICWSLDQSPLFDRISTTITAKIGKHPFTISAFNDPTTSHDIALYNSALQSTLSPPRTQECLIQNHVISQTSTQGDMATEKDSWVLSFNEEITLPKNYHLGSPTKIKISLYPELEPIRQRKWEQARYIVGGCPLLIHKRQRCFDPHTEKISIPTFYTDRHPRTAIGIQENGQWVCVVVDGRNPKKSIGMTLEELSTFMESLQCIHALNLDGGGSSTMVIHNEVVNWPVDEQGDPTQRYERPISDGIVFLQKNKRK